MHKKLKMREIILINIVLIVLSQTSFGQSEKLKQEKSIHLGIINGMATYLPKPEYTEEAKNFCAKGKVEVKVLINETGNVIKAKAISGDELLWNSSIKAAKKAKFKRHFDYEPLKMRRIIVYNFPSEKNCIYFGQIVNKKATYLPKPIYPKDCRCAGTVRVRIVIDMDGKVVFANAVSGNPSLRLSAVESALKTKFNQSLIEGPRLLFIAYLKYVFYLNGKVKT